MNSECKYGVAVKIDTKRKVKVNLSPIKIINGHIPEYTGKSKVTPSTSNDIILETKNMVVKDNITISKIPYFEVGNNFGNTVYIGNEVQ